MSSLNNEEIAIDTSVDKDTDQGCDGDRIS